MEPSNRMHSASNGAAGSQLPSTLARPTADSRHEPSLSASNARVPSSALDHERYAADPDFQLRGAYENRMLDAAMPLFGLVMRLRTLDALPHIDAVHRQVRAQIDNVQAEMRQHGYEPAHWLAYSYGLCLYIDEAVMERPWGMNSCWSQTPLLSIFHDETWGGEKVFTVLSRLMREPRRYQDVLEFMYFALCLGLKGKYAIAPKGEETLNGLIHQLHDLIRELRGPAPQAVCDPYTHVAARNMRLDRQWPWWSSLALCGVALGAAYGFYSYRLHLITTEVLASLSSILLQ